MNIQAFTYGHTDKEAKIIENMAHYVGYHYLTITDTKSYPIEPNIGWTIFAYGQKTLKQLKAKLGPEVKVVVFPELSELDAKTGIESKRIEAFETLMKLKTADDPKTSEEINCLDVNRIEEDIRKQGVKAWTGRMSNGKTITITADPAPTKTTDISITFRELLALKAAMDTLQIKEFIVVYDDKIHNKQSG